GSQKVDQSCRRRPELLIKLHRELYWQVYEHVVQRGQSSFNVHRILGLEEKGVAFRMEQVVTVRTSRLIPGSPVHLSVHEVLPFGEGSVPYNPAGFSTFTIPGPRVHYADSRGSSSSRSRGRRNDI
ncbi:hypothetical protein E4U12_001611, partial [Claviceps purpurea]